MGVKVQLNPSLSKKLEEVRIRLAAEKAVRNTMIRLHKVLTNKPTPHKTGNLYRSINYEMRMNGEIIEGIISCTGAPYWVYLNFGTSKIDAINFVGQAITKVKPAKDIQKNFKKLYKSG